MWQSPPLFLEKVYLMAYYVYILANKYRNVLYTGVTNNLMRRVYEHKNHLDPNSFTAKYHVTCLVYFKQTDDIYAALEREKQINKWNRKRKEQLIETQNPTWMDQYPKLLE